MPAEVWDEGVEEVFELVGLSDLAEVVGGEVGITGSGELEGIYPGAESVEWEHAEEAFFGCGAVGNDPASAESVSDFWPEGLEGGSAGEVFLVDSMDF